MNTNGHSTFKIRPLKDLLHHFGHEFYDMIDGFMGNKSTFKTPHARDLINSQKAYMKWLNLRCWNSKELNSKDFPYKGWSKPLQHPNNIVNK